MRKTLGAAVAAFFLCAAAFGQTSAVSLQNQEGSIFYYIVDPPSLAGLTAGSPLLSSKVAEFFSAPAGGVSLASLAPDAEVRLDGLTDGPHLLVGFFAREGQDEFPVRVISLQVDSRIGVRFYAIFAEPALMTMARGAGRLADFARPSQQAAASSQGNAASSQGNAASPQENAASSQENAASSQQNAQAAAQETVPQAGSAMLQPVATFAPSYNPVAFTRERKGEFNVLPVSASRSWTLVGTRIVAVSGRLDKGTLSLSLTVPGGFSEQVSYFFYIFNTRSPGRENQVTLELKPRTRGNRGVCLLWKQGESTPRLLGVVTVTDTTIELWFDIERLPVDVRAAFGDSSTFDLTAGWFDRGQGTWEEFSYTTFSMADIPVIR